MKLDPRVIVVSKVGRRQEDRPTWQARCNGKTATAVEAPDVAALRAARKAYGKEVTIQEVVKGSTYLVSGLNLDLFEAPVVRPEMEGQP